MPKSKENMEQDEKKILSELIKNSKENIDTIAKHCGFSRQKTWRFIKQLEAKDLIWGYTAVFDEQKLGLKHFMMLAKRSTGPLKDDTVTKIIKRDLEKIVTEFGITIESSSYVHGEYDWVITFTAIDIIHAKKLADLLNEMHPGRLEKITILQTMMAIKKQYILNPNRDKLKDFI